MYAMLQGIVKRLDSLEKASTPSTSSSKSKKSTKRRKTPSPSASEDTDSADEDDEEPKKVKEEPKAKAGPSSAKKKRQSKGGKRPKGDDDSSNVGELRRLASPKLIKNCRLGWKRWWRGERLWKCKQTQKIPYRRRKPKWCGSWIDKILPVITLYSLSFWATPVDQK